MGQKDLFLLAFFCVLFCVTEALAQTYYPEDVVDQEKAKQLEKVFFDAHASMSSQDNGEEEDTQKAFIELCSNHLSSELEGAEELFFPGLSIPFVENPDDILLGAIERVAFWKLKLRDYNSNIVGEFFYNLNVEIESGFASFRYRDTDLGFEEQSIDVYLTTAYAIYGFPYPGVRYEGGCGGAFEVNIISDPPGAKIWWSTPFRQSTCQYSAFPEECQWREITGNSSILANGDRIFLAQWPDGKTSKTIRTGDDFESNDQLVLRPDL